MKYELKRQIKVNMICYCVPLFIALCALISGEYLAFAILFVIGAGLMINELLRIKKDKPFTFDENGFQIGETPYRYEDIEEVDSLRMRYIVWVRIIIGGEVVYRFDNSYENSNEFVKQLTLHGVEHNIFGR